MRQLAVAGLAVAALSVAWSVWVPAADAGFPGRDGRLMWEESMGEESDQSLDSPTGRLFYVFQSRLRGESFDDPGGLECDNRDPRGPCPYLNPSFSPDGKSVLVEAHRARDPDAPLPRGGEPLPARRAVLAVVGANERSRALVKLLPDLTEADREPSWSPDGRRIVFSGEAAGNRDLYVVNRDGSDLQRLTSHPGVDREPAWSVRGEIAFVRGNVLYRIRPDGTGLKRLDRRGRVPDWSPDGRRLVFSHERRLFILRRDGRHYRRMLRRGAALYPAWSPSGRRIAFRRGRDIYTATPTGRRLRRVYEWGCPCGRSPSRDTPRHIDWGPRQR